MEHIVFVGAHPDDFSACCGTALRLKDKYQLHIWDFTRGERGLQFFKVPMAECAATRTAEEQRVGAALGAEVDFLGEIDGEAYASRETVGRLTEKFQQFPVRAVFTHALADVHGDHLMTAVAVLKALQLAQIKPELYTFEFSYQSRNFAPRYYTDITEVMEKKLQIVRLYVCQNQNDNLAQNQLETNAFRGQQIQTKYAEAFGVYDNFCFGQKTIFSEL